MQAQVTFYHCKQFELNSNFSLIPGAVLKMGFDHSSFNMNRFKQKIKTDYGGSVNLNKVSSLPKTITNC